MTTLRARTARHLALATFACSLVPASANAGVIYHPVGIGVPANLGGVYINVETLQYGPLSTIPGWDLNPYSATSLSWFSAPGSGMMRYPGATPPSAGSLALGTLVDSTRSFGDGAVVVGTAPGNWRLNSYNYFGFRFVAADGLTHYGWGTFWIGSSINSPTRVITELAWETTPGAPIAVGDVGHPPNDDRAGAIVLEAGASVNQSGFYGVTTSPDPLPNPTDCAMINWCSPDWDVWYRINPTGQPGVLDISLCGSSSDTRMIVYRLDESTNTLEQAAIDGGSLYCGDPFVQNNAYIRSLYIGHDTRPILIRVPAASYSTINLSTTWTPIQAPVYTGGKLWFGGATFSPNGTSSDNGFFELALTGVDGSGGTGSGLAGSYGYLQVRSATTSTGARLTLIGYIEGSQPERYYADSNFRFTSTATDSSQSHDPIEFALPQDYYYRITSTDQTPTLTARTGCFCNGKMTEGTYAIDIGSFGVNMSSNQTLVTKRMNWKLELQPMPFTLPADINADGHVDANDLAQVLGSWGAAGGPADLDGDGFVGGGDLSVLLGAWTG